VLAVAVASEFLQAIGGRHAQVVQDDCLGPDRAAPAKPPSWP
jgi:hypothetical protein